MRPITQQVTPEQIQSVINDSVHEIVSADLGGYFDQAKVYLQAKTKRRFASGTDPDGNPWKPVVKRARGSGTAQPLRDAGILMASATANGPNSIERRNSTTLEIGTALPYAAIHQFGGEIKPVKAKYLWIPKSPEAARVKSPRNFPDFAKRITVVIFKSGRTGMAIERVKKKRGQAEIIIHWYLTKGPVKITARTFLGFGQEDQDKLGMMLDDYLIKNATS